MFYLTRNLIALRGIPRPGKYVMKDEPFTASEVDAEYYVSKGHATEAKPESGEPAPAPAARTTRTPVRPAAKSVVAKPITATPPVEPPAPPESTEQTSNEEQKPEVQAIVEAGAPPADMISRLSDQSPAS